MKILVIATHPDDETLGCGGTLLKARNEGHSINWLIVTNPYRCSQEFVDTRNNQISRVTNAFNFETVDRLGFPSTLVNNCGPDSLDTIREAINHINPDILYIPNVSDYHSDHTACHLLAMRAVVKNNGINKIYAYEVMSETEASFPCADSFVPNAYVDISNQIDEKLDILKIYDNEIQPDPLPRSLSAVEALARYRGASVGVQHAEAFVLLREIVK